MHRILVVRHGEGSAKTAVEIADDAALPALLADPTAHVWVDMSGAPEEADVRLLRDVFRFHPLAIEDCFEERGQPKIDEYPDYLYLIAHGLTEDSTADSATVVELDVFVGARYLVTYHRVESRSVAAVAEACGRSDVLLERGAMTILHAILDRQADGMENVLDHIAERVEDIEDEIFRDRSNRPLAAALAVKRNILWLRRWMAKQREVLLRLGRREFPLVGEADAMLFRDVHDHLARYTDALDNFREMLASVQEAYLSVVSNRMNEVMKFLTLFTTALIPLTVISSLYGMNFDHMPELHWRYGYVWALGLMAASLGTTLLYFRRRGWLGGGGGELGRVASVVHASHSTRVTSPMKSPAGAASDERSISPRRR